MTRVAIFPGTTDHGQEFHAFAGDKQSVGRTAGEALDALTPQLAQDDAGTLIIVQSWKPDPFFNAEQQARLAQLMQQWRLAQDQSTTMPAEDQTELDALVAAELRGSEQRAAQLLRELGQ